MSFFDTVCRKKNCHLSCSHEKNSNWPLDNFSSQQDQNIIYHSFLYIILPFNSLASFSFKVGSFSASSNSTCLLSNSFLIRFTCKIQQCCLITWALIFPTPYTSWSIPVRRLSRLKQSLVHLSLKFTTIMGNSYIAYINHVTQNIQQ